MGSDQTQPDLPECPGCGYLLANSPQGWYCGECSKWMDDPSTERAPERPWTFGPWQWFGHTGLRGPYLATRHGGRVFVLMPHAEVESCACCGDYDHDTEEFTPGCDPSENHRVRSGMRFQHDGMIRDGEAWARYEVIGYEQADADDQRLYRHDFAGIAHPDAELIALAPEMAEAILRTVGDDRYGKLPVHIHDVARKLRAIQPAGKPHKAVNYHA